jgi:hypothetical protein
MDQKRLAEIKKRVMDVSLAGWECYIDENPDGTTVRYGNSFVDLPSNAFYKTQNDPNTDELIRHAPQDIMDLITYIEGSN